MVSSHDPDSPPLPPGLAELLAGYGATPVTIGCSGHEVIHFTREGGPGLYLKTARRTPRMLLQKERLRLEWLVPHLAVPQVYFYAATDNSEYLLTGEIPGIHAAHPSHTTDIPHLLQLLAEGLRMFHGLPIAGCPFDARLDHLLADARHRADAGEIDESEFEADYQGRSAHDILRQAEQERRDNEDLVVLHGDYSLPNIIINNGSISGLIDMAFAGVGDRYNDLVCAAWSINYNLGPGHFPAFLRAYGIEELDQEKFEYYRLVKQLS